MQKGLVVSSNIRLVTLSMSNRASVDKVKVTWMFSEVIIIGTELTELIRAGISRRRLCIIPPKRSNWFINVNVNLSKQRHTYLNIQEHLKK